MNEQKRKEILEKVDAKKVALSARAIGKMKAGDKDKTDVGAYSTEVLSVKNVVDLYLENVIEDRHIFDEQSKTKKIVKGSRAIKGKIEARRTLYVDVVSSIGEKAAVEITRKDVVSLIKGIIDRGAQVQAGKVLSELTAAYEYCIGLDYFPDTFANPGLLAKSSLKQTRIKLKLIKSFLHLLLHVRRLSDTHGFHSIACLNRFGSAVLIGVG